ncbi:MULTISPECIES: SDR family NAD(P)-dependent oxidoreductase [unclassified Sphingomonas]|uniref:SDR family NAD(P)-dependent oxidoreductase n=1 Tax=unclassified Sphingomonas TaxID=196159 RepID=UPI00138F8621|nr:MULTISPECIES: SDR family NAD(P)-dependent oxidoreductase [unclassified Sphingomonas]MDY0968995.1 SDR family NAD(P)-dependent oxidoreductase [Sphingomonas sp. CFBP9021]
MRYGSEQFKKNFNAAGYTHVGPIQRTEIRVDVTGYLATRTFSKADQDAFAALSGDRNPMHVDPVSARRTQAGAPVVHGVHAVLWALDRLAETSPDRRANAVNVRFERFLYVGEAIEAVLVSDTADKVTIELRTDGTRAALITLGFTATPAVLAPPSTTSAAHSVTEPILRNVQDLDGVSDAFLLVGTPADAMAAFSAVARVLGPNRVRGFAALSTLVGMECPGLLSIFSKLSVEFDDSKDGEGETFHYTVRRVQQLLRSAIIDLQAPGLSGFVETFVRQPPIGQPSVEALRSRVVEGFSRDDRVLVVGGSRGLGELTAKLTALGGGDVTITYARGSQEAQAIATEITAAGGRCRAVAMDIQAPLDAQLALLGGSFTHCYYFATPPIFRKRGLLYDRAVLDNFTLFYVDAFSAIAQFLIASEPGMKLFFPSTSAIDERPKGALEYVIAKQAGEALCDELARKSPKARILYQRLPRILTDQTATVLPVRSADPLELLLPILADLHQRQN